MQETAVADKKNLRNSLIGMKNVGGRGPNSIEPWKSNTLDGCNVDSRVGSINLTWCGSQEHHV
jgi:hypothetical protein